MKKRQITPAQSSSDREQDRFEELLGELRSVVEELRDGRGEGRRRDESARIMALINALDMAIELLGQSHLQQASEIERIERVVQDVVRRQRKSERTLARKHEATMTVVVTKINGWIAAIDKFDASSQAAEAQTRDPSDLNED